MNAISKPFIAIIQFHILMMQSKLYIHRDHVQPIASYTVYMYHVCAAGGRV